MEYTSTIIIPYVFYYVYTRPWGFHCPSSCIFGFCVRGIALQARRRYTHDRVCVRTAIRVCLQCSNCSFGRVLFELQVTVCVRTAAGVCASHTSRVCVPNVIRVCVIELQLRCVFELRNRVCVRTAELGCRFQTQLGCVFELQLACVLGLQLEARGDR